MISQLQLQVTVMESVHEKIKKKLTLANTLFPNNEKMKEIEKKIAKICGDTEITEKRY